MGVGDAERRMAALVAEEHGCHTVILYGSRARGDATERSDFDLAGFRDAGPAVRDARRVDGGWLDAFVYPVDVALDPPMLRMLPGVVMLERDGAGEAILARLRELEARGPELPDDQRRANVAWGDKMLERIRGERTVEAHARRMALRLQALEDFFTLKGDWFRGDKHAFAWMRAHDAAAYAVFEAAFQPDASDEALEALVRLVYRGVSAGRARSDRPGR